MPFLNWREAKVKASVAPHPQRGSVLALEFPAESLAILIQALEDVFVRGLGELRLELPTGWTLFWKEREGESRLLLARPDAETWVTTAALTRDHGLALV